MISEENNVDSRPRLAATEARMRQLKMIYRNRTRSSSDIYNIQPNSNTENSNLLNSLQNKDIQNESIQEISIKSKQRNIPNSRPRKISTGDLFLPQVALNPSPNLSQIRKTSNKLPPSKPNLNMSSTKTPVKMNHLSVNSFGGTFKNLNLSGISISEAEVYEKSQVSDK